MAEINPTRINQPPVDLGQEMTPDGNPITQMAAPASARRVAPTQTMEEAPTVDETTIQEETPATEQQPSTETTQEATTETTPTTEETQEPVVDFTKFLEAKDTGEVTDDLQKQKVKDAVEASPITHQKPPIAERKAQDAATRDLTGLPEELVPFFQKDMSRATFDKVKPLVLEHKTLKEKTTAQEAELERLRKGAIPDSYYDNPFGYTLDPSYQKAELDVMNAQAVLAHWQEQYRLIQDGAAEFQMAAFDQNGNLVKTNKVPAGRTAVTDILGVVNNAQQQMFRVAGKSEAIRENFKNRHETAVNWLNGYENKAFNFFNTEQGKAFEPQIKSIIAEFPSEFKNHPLARILAKSIATNVHLATLMVQNQKAGGNPAGKQTLPNGKPVTTVQQQRRAGPTVADVGAAAKPNGASANGKEDVSMDDFEKVKEGLE